MTHAPITMQSISLHTLTTLPFTHVLTIQSGPWTHTSHLELPDLTLEIHPRSAHNSILVAHTHDLNYAEPFDQNLAHFAGCISTLAKAFGPLNPLAMKHLLQGVSNAMIYFARQYGYVDFDIDEGVVTTTTKRDL